ncbi:MAG: GDP-L-fucose synthase [Ilumatobacteraceae bacterium]
MTTAIDASSSGTGTTVERGASVFVAGHRGLVGSAIVRQLQRAGFTNILTPSRGQLDLRDQAAVNYWFRANRPRYVYLVAGTVGGIWANSHRPAEFIYDNLMVHATVVHASHVFGVEKLLYLGSSCIYPRLAEQPMTEEALLTGPLEPTNEPYAIAKIAGIKLCESYREQYGCNFISAMPTNLYGINDNFDLQSSHVLPALMRKMHEAKLAGERSVEVWGTGTARREFLYVDDLAEACLFLMEHYHDAGHVNVGTGVEVSIRELGETLLEVIHPGAALEWDASKPDGAPRKLLDVSRMRRLGWTASTPLADGVRRTYDWFQANYDVARGDRRARRRVDGAGDTEVVQGDLRPPEDPQGVGEQPADCLDRDRRVASALQPDGDLDESLIAERLSGDEQLQVERELVFLQVGQELVKHRSGVQLDARLRVVDVQLEQELQQCLVAP